MNPAKLKQLEKVVRIGGKGSTRRKHKHIPRPSMIDVSRLRSSLMKLPMSVLRGIQQVHLSMQDGGQKVMHFPKVECSIQSNVYIINSESSEIMPHLVPIEDAQSQVNLHGSKKKEKKPRIRCRARNKAMKAARLSDLDGDGVSVTSCSSPPAVQPDQKAAGSGDGKSNDDKDKPNGGHNDEEGNPDGKADEGGDDGNANALRVADDNDPKHMVSIFSSPKGVPVEELLEMMSLSKNDSASSKEARLRFCSDSDSELDELLFGEIDSAAKGGNQDKNQNQDRTV